MGLNLLARWNDWSGGDYGLIGAQSAAANQFSGLNVVVDDGGSIGPAGTLQPLTFATAPVDGVAEVGWIASNRFATIDYGRVWWTDRAANWRYATLDGSTVTSIPTSTYAWSGAASGIIPTQCSHWNDGFRATYIVDRSAGLHILDHVANTIKYQNSITGGTVCIHNDNMFIGATTGAGYGQRVRYSATGDYTTWPSTSYFDLPNPSQILAVVPQRTHLLIIQADMTVWMLTGTVGVNDTLRQVQNWSEVISPYGGYRTTDPKWFPHSVARANNGDVWTTQGFHPARFRGAQVQLFDTVTAAGGVLAAGRRDDEMMWWDCAAGSDINSIGAGFTKALHYRNGRFTRHTAHPTSLAGVTFAARCSAVGPHGSMIIGGYHGSNPPELNKLFVWNPDGQLYRAALDNSNESAQFITSEARLSYKARAASGCLVPRHAEVRYTTTAATSSFEIQLNFEAATEYHGTQSTVSQSFTPPTTVASGKKLFSFEPVRCESFTVEFGHMVGVKIDEVLVYGDGEPARVG